MQTAEANYVKPVGPFSVTKSDVEKLGKSPVECSQLPEELGGGYMGTVEVFHQLHCLVRDLPFNPLTYDLGWERGSEFVGLPRT